MIIGKTDTLDVSSDFVIVSFTNGSGVASAGYGNAFTGDGSSIFVWGAQFEENPFASSYIPTSGAAVTRSRDLADVPVSDFNYSDTEYTLFTDFQSLTDSTTVSYISGFLKDSDSANRAVMRINTSSEINLDDRLAGTGQAGSAFNQDYALNTFSKIAFGYKEDDFGLAVDGGSLTTDTNADVGIGATTLAIGRGFFSSNTGNNHYKQITYFARRLDDATLQALTQPSLEPSLSLVFDSSGTSFVDTELTR